MVIKPIISRIVEGDFMKTNKTGNFREVKIPESILDTESWLSDREIVEMFYEDVDPKILDQIDKEVI